MSGVRSASTLLCCSCLSDYLVAVLRHACVNQQWMNMNIASNATVKVVDERISEVVPQLLCVMASRPAATRPNVLSALPHTA